MIFKSKVVSSAVTIALTCAVSVAAYYFKKRCEEINEVMVFCKLQFNAYNCFDKLMSYIESAKCSVSVCMPGIHNPAIQARLVQLIKMKKIAIRIIIDRTGLNDISEAFINELLDAGAEVKCKIDDPVYKMQHKFCLVDDRLLMTGTLNWGDDLTSDNWNYVFVTTKDQLVNPVKKEFYQMWSEYSSDFQSGTQSESYSSSDESADMNTPVCNETFEKNTFDVEPRPTPELMIL